MGFLGAIFGGGPSHAMENVASHQQSLADSLFANYQERYADQTDLLKSLRNSYMPLVAAGPNQQGFSSPVLATLNTQILNSGAAAARNARQAAGNFTAGQNNTSGLTSGITRQINSSINSQAANQVAGAQANLTQKNYELGRDNYFRSVGGMQALAGEENPGQFADLSGSNLNSSYKEQSQINDEKNAQKAALAGGIVSLATDVATAGLGGFANLGPGESFSEGLSDFGKGAFGALSGNN